MAAGIAKAETDLSVLHGFLVLGHERRYVWIMYILSRVVLVWMNHYSFIGLLWHSVLFSVFHISQSLFSPEIFFIRGLFQMCISHGFPLSYALSVVLALNTGPGVLWLEKKKQNRVCIFILIYGIYCNLSMVKSINALGPSSKKKKKCASLYFTFLWRFSFPHGCNCFFPTGQLLLSVVTNSLSAVPLLVCLICADIF